MSLRKKMNKVRQALNALNHEIKRLDELSLDPLLVKLVKTTTSLSTLELILDVVEAVEHKIEDKK